MMICVSALLTLTVILGACSRGERETPKKPLLEVGLVAGLSGPTAAWGEAIRRGAELAVEEVNREARSYTLALRIEDDGGRAEDAAALVTKLITRDGVVAVVGNDTSSKTMSMVPVCDRYKIPIVTPTASNPEVTRRSNFAFRVCATDDYEAHAAAALALNTLETRRVAILRDVQNDYSTGLAAEFQKYFVERGGTVTLVRDYAQGDGDFRAQLSAIAATKPQLLFIPGYYPDVAQIATQTRDLGLKFILLGGSGWDSPKLVEIGGQNLEGSYFVGGERSARPEFVRKFEARYGVKPDSANALSFDAVMLIATALDRADGKANLRDGLSRIEDFPGASGNITIGPDRNPRKPLAIFKVTGGRFSQVGTVTPERSRQQ